MKNLIIKNNISRMSSDSISVLALLTKKKDIYTLTLRWFLYESGKEDGQNEMSFPLPKDKFKYKVLKKKGVDKKIVLEGEVSPKEYLMLDPPRERVDIDSSLKSNDEKPFQMVAKYPEEPVDVNQKPVDGIWPDDKSFGSYHFLQSAHKSDEEERVYKALEEAVKVSTNEFLNRLSKKGISTDLQGKLGDFDQILNYTRGFSHWIVRNLPVASLLPIYIRKHYKELLERRKKRISGVKLEQLSPDNPFGMFESTSESFEFQMAAIMFKSLSKKEVLQTVMKVSQETRSLRGTSALQAIHGGCIIDYWCSPTEEQLECNASEDRGKVYPSAEVIGTGVGIDISKEKIEEIARDGWSIFVEISHIREDDESLKKYSKVIGTPLDEVFKDGKYELKNELIKKIINSDVFSSSIEIKKPSEAKINFDMIHSNPVKPNAELYFEDKTSISYGTGDGRIEILIAPPQENLESDENKIRNVFSYLIYGLWESTDTQKFFENPEGKWTHEDLRRWLITRKYSRETDFTGLENNGAELPAVEKLLEDPPWEPFHRRNDEDPNESDKDKFFDRTDLRDAKLNDKGDEDGLPLPDLFNKGFTIFSYDLRVGWDKLDENYWDPKGKIYTDWKPNLGLDNKESDKPLRYLFYVASVDTFNQVSEPVPVKVNDPSTSLEGYYFEALRRAPLMAPPGFNPDNTEERGRTLDYNSEQKVLNVKWHTPFETNISGNQSERKVVANEINAILFLFRRHLSIKIDYIQKEEELGIHDLSTQDYFDKFPHWKASVESWVNKGWRLNSKPIIVESPGVDGIWKYTRPITENDFGYEFQIGIAFIAKDETFWMKSTKAPTRCVQYIREKDQEYELLKTTITESPGVSDLVPTNIEPVPSEEPARPVTRLGGVNGERLISAKPILSPEGKLRDVITMKLCSMDYKNDPQEELWPHCLAHDFFIDVDAKIPDLEKKYSKTQLLEIARQLGLDSTLNNSSEQELIIRIKESRINLPERFKLNSGQIRLLKACIERTGHWENINIDSEFALNHTRSILARSLVRDPQFSEYDIPEIKSEVNYYNTPVIGFRGIKPLRWSYTPLAVEKVRVDEKSNPLESEALAFNIYSVRIRVDDLDERSNYSSFTINGSYGSQDHDNIYTFTFEWPEGENSKLQDNLTAIKSGIPVFSIISLEGKNEEFYSNVVSVERNGKNSKVVISSLNNRQIPTSNVDIEMFIAQPLLQEPVTDLFNSKEYEVLVPVGGGHREIFCWWVRSVSAQEKESRPITSANDILGSETMFFEEYLPTISPLPPEKVFAFSPYDKDNHVYEDVVKYKKWLPSNWGQDEVESIPRTVLAWTGYDRAGTYLKIEKERKTLSEANKETFFRNDNDFTDWDALNSVDESEEKDKLEIEWLNKLNSWILGTSVPIPPKEVESFTNSTLENRNDFIRFQDKLQAEKGVKDIRVVSFDSKISGLVDYYKGVQRDPFDQGMDIGGSFSYRYRITPFIDLGENIYGVSRWLPGTPTSWTSFIDPETMPIRVSWELFPEPINWEQRQTPKVEFLVSLRNPPNPDKILDEEKTWFYRIIIRRELNYSLPAEPDEVSKPILHVVGGKPLDIQGSFGGVSKLIDENIDRKRYSEPVNLKYQIEISQYYKIGEEEIVVRSADADRSYEELTKDISIDAADNSNKGKEACYQIGITIEKRKTL